jgi:hypothetical protein
VYRQTTEYLYTYVGQINIDSRVQQLLPQAELQKFNREIHGCKYKYLQACGAQYSFVSECMEDLWIKAQYKVYMYLEIVLCR